MAIDFTPFSKPLADHTEGINLRYDPIYDQIKEARFEEDATLSMGIWERELKRADWGKVEQLCVDALNNTTKDIQIAGWLCEAWCHLYGWDGLNASFEGMQNFCHTFWTSCYPTIESEDEDDPGVEHRIRICEWFLEMITDAVLFMPIAPANSIIPQTLDFATWLSSLNFDSIARRSGNEEARTQEAESAGQITLNRYRTIVKQGPIEHLTFVLEVVKETLPKTYALENELHEKCFGQEPIFTKIREYLQDIERICNFALEGRQVPVKATIETVENTVSTEDQDDLQQTVQMENSFENDTSVVPEQSYHEGDDVTISSREDAYKAIGDLADFLIDLDAQSPGPYLIKMVSTWYGKSLPQILDDIASGTDQGYKILKMLVEIVKTS